MNKANNRESIGINKEKLIKNEINKSGMLITKKRRLLVKSILVLVIYTYLIIAANIVYGHWGTIIYTSEKHVTDLNTGKWIREAKVYDPEHPENVQRGQIIVRMLENGEAVYYAINSVNANDPLNDPNNVNTSGVVLMKYTECTKEYRSFHRYSRGDFVVFNRESI